MEGEVSRRLDQFPLPGRSVDQVITILLILVIVKTVIIGIVLLVVFKPDIKQLRSRRPAPATPVCMYCQSKWTHRADDGETRWDQDELVLVTTYECEHCHLPFWHVERVPVGSLKH